MDEGIICLVFWTKYLESYCIVVIVYRYFSNDYSHVCIHLHVCLFRITQRLLLETGHRIGWRAHHTTGTSLKYIPRRAVLYVPGNDERKLRKLMSLDVDCAVLDCEDGVALNKKVPMQAWPSSQLQSDAWMDVWECWICTNFSFYLNKWLNTRS